MKKITITYFEPFGSRTTNVSLEAANKLNFNKIMLPVVFDNVEDTIKELVNNNDYLIMLGEAGSYEAMKIELIAHNIKNGKDNNNIEYHDELIKKDSPLELSTNINFTNFNFNYSKNAGKYLCNYSYYLALYHTTNCKVCFIHLPYLNDSNNLDFLINELNRIIDFIIH